MNKPAVFLLVVVSCLFTFVASGNNSEIKDQRLLEYKRIYVKIDDAQRFAAWEESTPSGNIESKFAIGKLPGHENFTHAGANSKGESIGDEYESFYAARKAWRLRLDAHLAMLSETWEVFQIDVADISALGLSNGSVGEEVIHFRRKSR